jgi:hypothetical protein
VFLINSRRSRFTETPGSYLPKDVHPQGHPLSRTYGAILQSSLTSVLPSALDYSSRLPVSVLVRSPRLLAPKSRLLEAFLGRASDDFSNVSAIGPVVPRMGWIYLSPASGRATDVSTRTAHPTRAVPPSRTSAWGWRRNVDLLSIVYAFRPRLRHRLTLGGITFPRKP